MRIAKQAIHGLDQLSTGVKLALAFGLVLILTALLGGSALFSLSRVNQASDELASKWLPSVGHLASARAALLEVREFEVKHTSAADAGYMSEYEEKMAAALQPAQASLKAHAGLVSVKDEQDLRAALDKQLQAYLDINQKVIAMSKAQQQTDAKDVSEGAGKSNFDDAIVALDKLTAYSLENGHASSEVADGIYRQAKLSVTVLVGVALLMGAVLAWMLTRNLLGQLGGEPRHAAAWLQRIAAGDLSTEMPIDSADQTSLMAGLQKMQNELALVVASVRQGSDSVATASAEIAQGNNDLSVRTEHQASALQQTSSSMNELNSQVMQNAESARQANALASQATQIAVQGGGAVNGVVTTMKGISTSSARIAEITGVIDSIAFQTNILALNAAVEAARAGEQGRGFAVVASEVRSLAQRSATAAKEINSLITASVDQIRLGSQQVNQAGETMAQVVNAIQQVNQIVDEITAASGEQSGSVRRVGDAITLIDQGTQQNAALVEQSAAAADSLRTQAAQLVQAVAFFKLGR